MAHPATYDPYYLHHNNHREPPPEYYYHRLTTSTPPHTYLYNEPPPPLPLPPSIISNPIHIPEKQRHINTLFVSGLPDDVIPREIHNLFRRRPGFESCQLKFTGRRNEVVAFVTFINHQSAVLALQALDGVPFDPEDGSVLNIELARSNSRRKRTSGSGPYVVIDNRRKVVNAVNDVEEMSSEDGDKESNKSCKSEDPTLSSDDDDDDAHSTEKSDVKKADLKDPEASEKKQTEKTADGELQPCSTLFIANLGPKCTEDELRQAISPYPGLNGLNFRARRGMAIAFADYEEVEQATTVMQALQDSTLPSSDRGGMVIEYARSKMRKP